MVGIPAYMVGNGGEWKSGAHVDAAESTVMSAESRQALTLTTDPRLDQAAVQSAANWETASRKVGAVRAAAWLARRLDDPDSRDAIAEAVEQLLTSDAEDELAESRIELAELIEGCDDLLAETLLEAVREYGVATDDGEMLASISAQLAAIAERQGDTLTAAGYHLDFLNWRRQPGHVSDPDDVQASFDELVRYADIDGEPAASALFTYRQAAFSRLSDAEDDRATEGDWERDGSPYEGWD